MNDGSTDGHYYRDDHGITQGPLDFEEFERLQIKGRIKPGMKVWRQKAGAYFQVQMKRRYTIGKMFSFSSVGYFFELIFILISLLMIIFIFRAPKLQEELMNESDGVDYLLGVLLLLTVVMTLFSIKKSFHRLSDSSSSVVSNESPV